jgi:hypothetical protein
MRKLLFAITIASASLGGCSKDDGKSAAAKKHADEFPEMSPDEVDRGLAAKQVVVVDCNSDKTRKKYGIVPGAILIADEEAIAPSELPSDKAAKLVFYCSGPG